MLCDVILVRRNDGIVIAEQLAPFLDPPAVSSKTPDINEYTTDKADGLSVVVDESWVLPAVLQLGGMVWYTTYSHSHGHTLQHDNLTPDNTTLAHPSTILSYARTQPSHILTQPSHTL